MKKRIMILDDDDSIRSLYKNFLVSEGYDVIDAASCEEACEYLLRQKIDLLLLDIHIPELDGRVMHEVMEEYDKSIPVIVASVYPLDKQRRIVAGAADYFDKAEGVNLLLSKIRRILGLSYLAKGP